MAVNAPVVSVIIPAFNASAFVAKAIESVLLQTYRPVEIVAVDDGSTDRTMDILLSYGDKIRAYRQGNKGPAGARNLALANARGQYLMFLDADDCLLPQKISRQVEILERNPAAGWTYCDIEYVNGEGRRLYLASDRFSYANRTALNGILFPELLRGNFIPVHASLIRRESLFAVAPFDEDKHLIGVEDWDLLMRLSSHCEALYIPEVLGRCVVHAGSLSSDPMAREFRRFYLLDKTIRTRNRDIRALGITGLKIIADTHNWFAYRQLEEKRWKEAVHRLLRSLATYPFQRRALVALVLGLIHGARGVITKHRPFMS